MSRISDDLRAGALASTAWPMQEAKRILAALNGQVPEKGYVLFETGYGPSGLPHLGTFGEVVRTSMVRYAFQHLSDIPTRLIAFSDDMDGLRKIPTNLPNQAMLQQHLGKSLTNIPDPFGTHASFGAHMNARLIGFLEQFGFDCEFKSATECYQSGLFDDSLRAVLHHYDSIMAIMLPTLGEERQETYSPFLPVCPESGQVLQVPILGTDPDAGTIRYRNHAGDQVETPVTGGRCKLQWKVDWAMRWVALHVDYEMYGKDLIPSAELSAQISTVLGKHVPVLFQYEHFLDQDGRKISKSKGNGLSIEEWLTYAPTESLALYMYQSPRKAKRLYFDVIPKQMDEYLIYMHKFSEQTPQARLDNPLYYVHQNQVPPPETSAFNFSMLLNLVSICNPDDPSVLWGFITQHEPTATPDTSPLLAKLVPFAMRYYQDFVQPHKKYHTPTEAERTLLLHFKEMLHAVPEGTGSTDIQNGLYDFARTHAIEDTKQLFSLIYTTLLGQVQGPRLGTFIAIYGPKKMAELVETLLELKNPSR